MHALSVRLNQFQSPEIDHRANNLEVLQYMILASLEGCWPSRMQAWRGHAMAKLAVLDCRTPMHAMLLMLWLI